MEKNEKSPSSQRPLRPHEVQRQKEKEFAGPAWKHPYMIYVWLTVVLFLFLLVMGYLAKQNDWIPDRGIHSN